MDLVKKNWLYSMFEYFLVALLLSASFEETNAWGEFFSNEMKPLAAQPPEAAVSTEKNVKSIVPFAKSGLPQASPRLPSSIFTSYFPNDERKLDDSSRKLSAKESNEESPAKFVKGLLKGKNYRRQPWQSPRSTTNNDGTTAKVMPDELSDNHITDPKEVLKTEYFKLIEKLNTLRESMKYIASNLSDERQASEENLLELVNKPHEKRNEELEKQFENKKQPRPFEFGRRRDVPRKFLGPLDRFSNDDIRRRVNTKNRDDEEDDESMVDREKAGKKTTETTTTSTTTTTTPATTVATSTTSLPRTTKDDRLYFPEEDEKGGNYINEQYMTKNHDKLDKELDETLNRLREKIRKAIRGEEIDEHESSNDGYKNDVDHDEDDDLFYPEGSDTSCPKNEVYTECGSICEPSCDTPYPDICAKICFIGCRCEKNFYRDEKTGRCVKLDQCYSKI